MNKKTEKVKVDVLTSILAFINSMLQWFTLENMKNLINWDYLEELAKNTDSPVDDWVIKIVRQVIGA